MPYYQLFCATQNRDNEGLVGHNLRRTVPDSVPDVETGSYVRTGEASGVKQQDVNSFTGIVFVMGAKSPTVSHTHAQPPNLSRRSQR
jgi:hypothetical protein